MSLIILLTLVVWAGGITASLVMARDLLRDKAELSRGPLWLEVKTRGGACLAAAGGLVSLAAVASITSDFHSVWVYVPPAWLASSIPLMLPTGRAPLLRFQVSHLTLVGVSIALTIAFGLSIAFYHLARLLQSHPEFL